MNNDESSVSFDPNNKISVIRNIISLSLKVNFTEYELFYNKKKISYSDDRLLKELIGNDKNPTFYIRKKGINCTIKFKDYDKEMKYGEDLKKLKNKILVENFPSRMEIFDMLNKFLNFKNYPKAYDSEQKGNAIQFSFSDPVNNYIRKLY